MKKNILFFSILPVLMCVTMTLFSADQGSYSDEANSLADEYKKAKHQRYGNRKMEELLTTNNKRSDELEGKWNDLRNKMFSRKKELEGQLKNARDPFLRKKLDKELKQLRQRIVQLTSAKKGHLGH